MDDDMKRALAAGLRAAADALDPPNVERISADKKEAEVIPSRGSAASMLKILEEHERVMSEGKRVTAAERQQLAKDAGIDPRGIAGYFAAGLLARDSTDKTSSVLTETGAHRLERLRRGLGQSV